MTTPVQRFVDYWGQFEPNGPPYIHPADAGLVRQGDFDLQLLPVPVNGDLREAECVVLMLNPGLDEEDHVWEQREDFRAGLLNALAQTHAPDGHPFVYLDPAFERHPGAVYWAGAKFKGVIEALASRDGVAIAAAQAHVARNVAVIQLCPYHSVSMRRRALLETLPSSVQARRLAHNLVASGEKLVVAARAVRAWGFDEPVVSEDLVVYKSSQGRSASLSLSTAGGSAIVSRLPRVC